LTSDKASEIAEQMTRKYGMRVPRDVAVSVFLGQPKVSKLLSRASFRPDVDVRTQQRTRIRRERRRFIRTMLGVAGASVFGLLLLKAGSSPNLPQPLPITYTQNAMTQTSPATYTQNAVTQSGQLLANASNIPPDQALTFNDPTIGPIVLIHLDNGQFVAYSTTCTHAGCQVQFDPSSKDLICPCHGAVYDPYNNAQVLAGPAPFPLQNIPIQYDTSTGNIYLPG